MTDNSNLYSNDFAMRGRGEEQKIRKNFGRPYINNSRRDYDVNIIYFSSRHVFSRKTLLVVVRRWPRDRLYYNGKFWCIRDGTRCIRMCVVGIMCIREFSRPAFPT